MATETKADHIAQGQQDYQAWQASLRDTPEKAARYQELASRSDLWLQLVEARRNAGLSQRELAKRLNVSQAQVARIEKRGYESYTLNTLRRYLAALGDDYTLEVRVRQHRNAETAEPVPSSR